jgi:hypothetical protein
LPKATPKASFGRRNAVDEPVGHAQLQVIAHTYCFGGVQLGRVLRVDEDFGPYRAAGLRGRI